MTISYFFFLPTANDEAQPWVDDRVRHPGFAENARKALRAGRDCGERWSIPWSGRVCDHLRMVYLPVRIGVRLG